MTITVVEAERPDIFRDLQMEFTECPACAAKPGHPALCLSCLKNREVIERQKQAMTEARDLLHQSTKLENFRAPDYWERINAWLGSQ